jgi:hypothetical protein
LAYTWPVEAEEHAAEALAWARYAGLRDRWRRGFEAAAERTAAIGALLTELGADLEGEPDLGYYFAEVARAFVTFSNQLVSTADGLGVLMAEAEREWRSALERLPAGERADLEARRLADGGP